MDSKYSKGFLRLRRAPKGSISKPMQTTKAEKIASKLNRRMRGVIVEKR